MKVIVDPDLCEANGVCVSVAPEVFELQADDTLLVLDRTPSEGLRDKVEDAVDGCPRAALRIEED
ncbi:MAG: ferredoxin [Actinomycetota bacterium]